MSYPEQQSAKSDRSSSGRYKDFKTQLYKTELCRSYQETGTCPYGNHCQFAHGDPQLRPVLRHRKFKTEKCRNFLNGYCPYGARCCFVHDERGRELNCIRASANIPQPGSLGPLPAPANPYEGQAAQPYPFAHNYQHMMLPVNPMNVMSPMFTGHQGGVLSPPAMGEAVSLPPAIMTPPVFPGYQHSPHLLLSPPSSPASHFFHNPGQAHYPQYMMSPVSPISPPQTGAQMVSQAHTHQIYNPGNTVAPPAAQPHAQLASGGAQQLPAPANGENRPPVPYAEGEQRSSRKSSGEGMPSIMSMISVSSHAAPARGPLPSIATSQIPSSPAQNSTSSSRRSNGVPLSPTTHNAGVAATSPLPQDTYTPPRRPSGFTGKMMGHASSLGIKAVINNAGFMVKTPVHTLTRQDITADIHEYLGTEENNTGSNASNGSSVAMVGAWSNGGSVSDREIAEMTRGVRGVQLAKGH